jgi:hypothetical protein
MRPPCFSKAILHYDAPLPSSGSARAAFPSIIGIIRALRLPAVNTELLMLFASPPQPILSEFAPVRRRTPHRPGPVQARYRWLLSAGQSQDLPGSWRIHPVPLPRSRIPASSSALAFSAQRCSPHFADGEDTSTTDISRLNHAASVPAAYASSDALPHPHARLASGRWLALAGWESNPLDPIEKFPSSTSDLLLSQIYPGATARLPQSPGQQGQWALKSRVTR